MQSDITTPQARRGYYSILNMSKRIIHLAGLDGLDGDTILSVVACMSARGGDTEAVLPLAKIGSKLSIHSSQKGLNENSEQKKKTLEQAAGRRVRRLANGQRSIGKIFIGQTPGRLNPDTQRRESSTFTDFLTPAAQAALAAFLADTKKPKWGTLTPDEKRACFDAHAQAALDTLPKMDVIPTAEHPPRPGLTVTEYKIQHERTILGSIEKGYEKLLHTYEDPGAALDTLERLQAQVVKLKQSLRKQYPELRKDITISSLTPPAPGSGEKASEEEGGMVNTPLHEPPPLPLKMKGTSSPQLQSSKGLRPLNSEVLTLWAERYIQRFGGVLLNYGLTPDGACTCQHGQECTCPGKHPVRGTRNGLIRSMAELSTALNKVTSPNLGIPTGRETGITVLDFDGLEGRALFEQWQADGLILPDMLTAQTGGGGVHVVIAHVPGLSAKVRTLPGLDIKNSGGQIVTAPSLHRSGNVYTWKNWPGQVLPAPAALLAILNESTSFPPAQVANWQLENVSRASLRGGYKRKRMSPIPQGQRNQTVYNHLSGLAGGGHSIEHLRQVATEMNNWCTPPMDSRELESIIRSAATHPPNSGVVKGGRI